MNKIWKLADITVSADFTYPYLAKQCSKYESNEPAILSVNVTSADIEFERIKNKNFPNRPDDYLESLAFYRKFAIAALDYGVLLMHGSAICFKEKGYIYTAPSGTGKSTHSRLCKEVFGDKISYINDDKPLLRFVDGAWYVYGTPWDGSYHRSENVCIPLGAICKLKRGETNSIRKTKFIDSISVLMTQIYHPNDEVNAKKSLDLMLLLNKIPFWQLECNMDIEAAHLSLETMSDNKLKGF